MLIRLRLLLGFKIAPDRKDFQPKFILFLCGIYFKYVKLTTGDKYLIIVLL